jgi:hypothetical protein
MQSGEHDVMPTVAEGSVIDDASDADGASDSRISFVVFLPASIEEGHRNQVIGFECVTKHFAVARFENMEILDDVGKENEVGERE